MAAAPRALVTGATGLVGSHVVERLRADGWIVRALVRDAAAGQWLESLGCGERATGVITDADAVARAAAGCELIVHAAGVITPRGGWEDFRRTNLDGTHAVIAAAARAGARLLHLSSIAVYGPTARYRPGGRPTDESTPLTPLPDDAHYARSKRESEAVVLDAHARGRIWAAAVRPCVIYGRRDRQFTPRVARALRAGVAPLPGGGGSIFSIVHAANVADAAVHVAGSDQAGGRAYNTANDPPVTVARFVRLAGAGLGRTVRVVPIPLVVARLGVAVAGGAARLAGLGGLGNMLAGSVEWLTRDNPFSSERIRADLGWSPRVTPDEGVPDAFRWWRERA